LTFAEWFRAVRFYLAIFLVAVGVILGYYGVEFLLRIALVVLGLGFVIFIHELGHFLAAKWCDVHVNTFSIGFGPAFPGCSFRRGETTYKIAMVPLGGYVSMVGEGLEAEENEDYPRSFKNKTVGQRMLIISAGVIMNIILGALCFILVYRYNGVERTTANIASVEPGSPAWDAGVHSNMTIAQIGNRQNPFFDDLKMDVSISGAGRKIPFVFASRSGDGSRLEVGLEPRKDDNDPMPVIGVMPAPRLTLVPEKVRKEHELPVAHFSPAAFARVISLQPDDVVVYASDPDKKGELTELKHDLKARTFDVAELCRRLMKLNDELILKVSRAGSEAGAPLEELKVPSVGFKFGDTVVATTDPDTPEQPWRIKALPPDPTDASKENADYFEFRTRLQRLAGKPMVIQVRRHQASDDKPVSILVPPAYHFTLGARMKMGQIAAVREKSPAESAGARKGDVLSKVKLTFDNGESQTFDTLDPVRLPFDLAEAAKRRTVKDVTLTVLRPDPENHKAQESKQLSPVPWDSNWDSSLEQPHGFASPLSIPQLGLAYRVETTVLEVAPGSPAEKAGLKPGDQIEEVRYRKGGKTKDDPGDWGRQNDWIKLAAKRDGGEAFDTWAHVFWYLQIEESHEIQVKVRRDGNLSETPLELKAEPDVSWPYADRGLLLVLDSRLQKADNLGEAVTFGVDRTYTFIKQIYLSLARLFDGRISTKSMGGPIEIGAQAFEVAGEDFSKFVLFLGIISVNLAVVNFLPIPVLDGGHMVFLIYEKLRGRPPSETVRAGATYVGLALLLSLMVFVFYQDLHRRGWLGWW
jgi:regulator of sigma E protease